MLKDEFNAYYMAGVRMSWNFGSLYTLKNDRRRIDNTRQQIETGRDVFLFNIRLQATQQDAGIVSMRRQMAMMTRLSVCVGISAVQPRPRCRTGQ